MRPPKIPPIQRQSQQQPVTLQQLELQQNSQQNETGQFQTHGHEQPNATSSTRVQNEYQHHQPIENNYETFNRQAMINTGTLQAHREENDFNIESIKAKLAILDQL